MSKKVLSRGIRGLITSKQGSKNVRLTSKRDYLMRAGQASNGGTAGDQKRARSTTIIQRNQREIFRIATGMRRRMPTPTPSRIARTEAAPIAALERKSMTACQRLTKPSMQPMAGLGEVTKGMVYSCRMASAKNSTERALHKIVRRIGQIPSREEPIYAVGRAKTNVAPCASSLSARMEPPWARMMCLAMARPKPVPPDSRERALSTR